MKLSMWIFVDWLKEYKPQADIKAETFSIEAVRLFSSSMTLNDKTLYIGRLSDFFQNGNNNVICIHNNDMLILQTDDLEEILNSVLNAMEFYGAWNNEMMELVASGAMLQDFFTASAEVLCRPVSLLDAGLRRLAHHTAYGVGQVDELWDQMLEHGSASLEFLMELNQEHPQRFRRKGIYCYEDDVFPHKCYNKNFFYEKNWVGTVIMIELEEEISRGEVDVFALFSGFLDCWFQNHIQEQQSMVLDFLLQSAITDANAGRIELQRQLQLLGWKKTDSLLFIKLDASDQPFSINTYLCRNINANFKYAYAVAAENSICMLCNISRCPLEEMEGELGSWLISSKYYGVTGRPFHMEDSFFKNYKFTELVAGRCKKEPGKVYDGSRFLLHYIFWEMQHTIVPDVCHPALKILRDYDKEHHTNFYRTLWVYLKNERSLIDTAKELGLHRNSLSYRLNRLMELADMDLEEPFVRLHMLISYEIAGEDEKMDCS